MARRFRLLRIALVLFASVFALIAAVLVVLIIDTIGARQRSHHAEVFARDGDDWITVAGTTVDQRFSAHKAPEQLRIFIIGGSQAMGTPYVHQGFSALSGRLLRIPNEGGIATWLERYLALRFPGRQVQVVNAAQGGQDATHAARTYAEIVAKGSADLVLVLSGNNERPSQGLDRNRQRFDGDLEALLAQLTQRHRAALTQIRDLAGQRGVETWFMSLPSNLRHWLPSAAPVPVDLPATLREIENGGAEAVLRRVTGWPTESPRNALRLFIEARAHDHLGRHAHALRLYRRARDLDRSFLRVRSAWNAFALGLRGPHVRTFDLASRIEAHAPEGIPGSELFVDYCHLNLRGYRRMAWEIARRYGRIEPLPERELPLESVPLEDRSRSQLRRLYLIKSLKWLRGRFGGEPDEVGELNAETVSRNYRDLQMAESLVRQLERRIEAEPRP